MIEYYKNLSLEPIVYKNQFGKKCVEQWVDIIDYEDIYQGSDLGRFKRKERMCAFSGKKNGVKKIGEKIMKMYVNEDGYFSIGLTKNKKQKTLLTHRLLAAIFIPNPEDKPYVNHLDCDKLNNVIWNLEWSTVLENNNHSWENGRNKLMQGELNGCSKLTEKDVLEIRKLHANNTPRIEISQKFGVHKNHINRIVSKKRWKHI